MRLGEHDERDPAERLQDPHPEPMISPFARREQPFDEVGPLAAGEIAVACLNRVLPDEGVPGCRIGIGAMSASANGQGDATLQVSGLADGEHDISVIAPHVSDMPVGPGFPVDTSKDRIWRPLRGTVHVENGRIVRAEPSDAFKLSGTRLTAHLRPVWLKVVRPVSSRPQPPDMITIHHTASNLQSDLNTFLYAGTVSVHYLVGPDGSVYKLVDDAKTAAHAGFSAWQGDRAMNGRSIGI